MSINAIAKKKLGFRNGDTGEILTVSPFEYETLPDWVKKDPMFQWAVADGSIEVPKEKKPREEGGGTGDKQQRLSDYCNGQQYPHRR